MIFPPFALSPLNFFHSSHKICCPHLWSLQETLTYTNTHTCMQTRSCLSSSPAASKRLKFKKKKTPKPFERLAHFVPAAFALLSYWTSCWKITPVIQHLVCFNCIKVRESFFLVSLSLSQKWTALAFDAKKREDWEFRSLKYLILCVFLSTCLKGCQSHETGAIWDSHWLEVLWEPDGFWALFPLRGGELWDRYDPSCCGTLKHNPNNTHGTVQINTDEQGYEAGAACYRVQGLIWIPGPAWKMWVGVWLRNHLPPPPNSGNCC